MDFIWIFFAFVCGLAAKSISLPPSIGYLMAGFVLHFFGLEADDSLEMLANLGITLMLFTIGLKFNIKDLLKAEILAGSLSHTSIWMLIGLLIGKVLLLIGIEQFTALDTHAALLVVFALSFSSTVCVVKLFEEYGEMRTRHGKIAIGILVIQDIMAVIFLVAATGKTPAIEALALLLLIPAKPILHRIVQYAGHGELIPLMGFFIAFGSYELFELVNIKGDLGALLAGMYLATHSKASELTKSLLSFKDIFLIGFFLSIGFTALPDWQMLTTAMLLTIVLPIKFVMFYLILTRLKIRARSAFLSSISLTNYSEFGLIVASISVCQWLVTKRMVGDHSVGSVSFIYID